MKKMKIFEIFKNQLKSISSELEIIIILKYIKNDVERCVKIKKT